MPLALHIDTALETSLVAISDENNMLAYEKLNQQNEVGKWLHLAINSLFAKTSIPFSSIDFVSATEGPGSYTGLRIGMSAAKGICFSINKPLITISNLSLYVHQLNAAIKADFYIPVIDARRNEVYTAVYNHQREIIKDLHSVILNDNSFEEYYKNGIVCICGNAVKKITSIIQYDGFITDDSVYSQEVIRQLAFAKFTSKLFSDTIYCEPQYGKPFHFH